MRTRRWIVVTAASALAGAGGVLIGAQAFAKPQPAPAGEHRVLTQQYLSGSDNQPQPGARAASVTPFIAATNAHCGMDVEANLTLNGDLVCTHGTALYVTAANAVLNLNGHMITGPLGAGTLDNGVEVLASGVTVENGTVVQFHTGVWVHLFGSTLVNVKVTNITANFNEIGVEDEARGTTATNGTKVTNSYFAANTISGIVCGFCSGASYTGNRAMNSPGNEGGFGGFGVEAFEPQQFGLLLTSNIVTGNRHAGIQINGGVAKLAKNSAYFNGDDGIVADTLTRADGLGNLAKGNDWADGNNPEQCYGVACS